ncbi:sugar ABC transporter ATP-binding protein [Alkalibacter saccharofermentans]|uniref:Ribose transport system ATP-binding protein n=1 Tax=Alkalibacter saccharofermentans DSM 14828 TaxID=1120975 RepID=A0A1M4USG9_9FIRM|nr:sugar ABC transporter ATP-binding protein [Alkalibacter saccharofermentans]SHE59625.1 ribose transport system ATP-binding protein [Alkalibacter saccharofermentans DSM 14828]
MEQQVILKMKNIKKSFGSVSVLKSVNFNLKKGEVHALVGGNGAGKSTLMKIMTGVYALDEGEIFIEGKLTKIEGLKDAKERGIAMIFQELSLIQTMTVAENIFLGDELKKGVFRDVDDMNQKTKKVLHELGIEINPNTPMNQLSVGMSQMVEIAKAILKNAKILILDEPTASLSTAETKQLFKIIRDLKTKGVSMVYISHRMNEIIDIADSISILRDGELVLTESVQNINLDQIINHMTGGEDSRKKFEWIERHYDLNGEDLLSVQNLKVNDRINNISFLLKPGEILGIAGLMGSGRTEILETLFGLRKKISGTVLVQGQAVESRHSSDAIKAGFALVPEDRRKQGLILENSVKENCILPIIKNLTRKGFIIERVANEVVRKNVLELNVVTNSIHKTIKLLSGGNQQKIVISKWLNTNPKIMMLDEPTAGVDIGAKSEILQIVRKFADEGNGVILVSSELTELLATCDRIIILFDGRITGEMPRQDIKSEEELQYAIQKSQ